MMSRKLSMLSQVSLSVLVLLFIASPVVPLGASAAEQAPAPAEVAAPSPIDGATAAAACARCGDGYCARSCENEFTCPADCAPRTEVAAARCGKCGDGQCVRQCGETAESCPVDCGGVPVPSSTTGAKQKDCDQSAGAAAPQPEKKQ